MGINLVLFAAITRVNTASDIEAPSTAERALSFALQELTPPLPVQNVPKEEVKKPEPDQQIQSTELAQRAPSQEPPLDISFASLGGLAVAVNPFSGAGNGGATTRVKPSEHRVFSPSEVQRRVQELGCSAVSDVPSIVRRRGLSGAVRVRAVVTADGKVQKANVIGASGDQHPSFEREALRHLSSCRFAPAERGGQQVAQWVEKVYQFENQT
jgi:TonB family protein